MKKLSEIRGDDALDVLAEILEPVSEIFTDNDFVDKIRKEKKIQAASIILKNHKAAILKILAILKGVDPGEYNPSLIELPMLVLGLMNDPELLPVFHLAGLKISSGSAMENTEETEHE